MLVSKLNKDDIITLKLVTGEEVITKVIENKDDCLIVSKPFAFIMQKVGPAMAPMMISADWETNPVYIYKQGVTMTANPENKIKSAYLNATSTVFTPDKPSLVV